MQYMVVWYMIREEVSLKGVHMLMWTNEKKVFTTEIAGKPFTVEIGEMAKQSNGACLVEYGDTSVLATVTASDQPKDLPFFPLTVNYEERLYAVGKIPGGFIKREGRPSEKAVLASRLIDRPLRPLFPEGFRNEVQVISTVMSVDQDCSSEIAAMIGSSLSLSISDIPFDGPIAGVNVGRIAGEFVINPTVEEQANSDLFLTVAGTKDAINMVEAEADEVSEDIVLDAILFGHKEISRLVQLQEDIVAEIGREKREVVLFTMEEDLLGEITADIKEDVKAAIKVKEKHAREDALDKIKEETLAKYEEQEDEDIIKEVKKIIDNLIKEEDRNLILNKKLRDNEIKKKV